MARIDQMIGRPSGDLRPDPAETKARTQTQAKDAARQLEAYFIRQVLKDVRPEGGSLDGGYAGGVFREMLDEALAESMSKAGSIGIAPMIERELNGKMGGLAGAAGASGARPTPGPESLAPSRVRAAYRLTAAMTGQEPPLARTHALPAPAATALPVEGVRTSGYGLRADPIDPNDDDPKFHAGIDIAASRGTPVRSARAGVVTHAGPAGGYGNLVVVDHGGGVETRYAHLAGTGVRVGERLAAGAELGTVGQTGRATGPHLHFEVRKDGHPVDPARELPRAVKISR